MAEIVADAGECPAGTLHLWPEVGWVEVLESAQPIDSGAPRELVCTGLLNADMPLIRYRAGDSGVLPVVDEVCSCRRTLATLASIEGRADDLLFTLDGGRIGRLDPSFKTQLPVREAQIIQETLGKIRCAMCLQRILPRCSAFDCSTVARETGHGTSAPRAGR
jgi:hypothetical protein